MKTTGKVILAFTLVFVFACKKKDNTTQTQQIASTVTINTSLPSVSTISITTINLLTVGCSAIVSSEGTSAITAVGICWDTLPAPTTLRLHTNEGAGTGSFTSLLQGLKSNTTYHVRAYATNATGTAYGNEITFKTGEAWDLVNFYKSATSLVYSNNTLFAGTSEGIYRSTDEGNQWSLITNGLSPLMFIQCMAENGNTIFAGTNGDGIYRSTDGGTTWTSASVGLVNSYILGLFSNGSTIFASTYYGLSVSSNNGASWTTVNSGLNGNNVNSIAFSGSKIFAATTGGLYVSLNNGINWTQVSSGGIPAGAMISAVGVSGNAVLANTNNGLYRSVDNGSTWSAVATMPPSQVFTFFTKNGATYAGTYNSIYVSRDNGASFLEYNAGLPSSAYLSFAASANYLFTTNYSIYRVKL